MDGTVSGIDGRAPRFAGRKPGAAMVSSQGMGAGDREEGEEQRTGTRRHRRTRSRGMPDDDRPRGFQPQRMRHVWREVDAARDKLGLGDAAAALPAACSVAVFARYAGELTAGVGDVVADIAARGARQIDAMVGALPAVLHAAFDLVPWLRAVPILGQLVGWPPPPNAPEA